jgi:hypothetical protein
MESSRTSFGFPVKALFLGYTQSHSNSNVIRKRGEEKEEVRERERLRERLRE